MWEDERAPAWRRRLLLWRCLTGAAAILLAASVVGVFITNSLWLFLTSTVLAVALFMTSGRAATYRGRLDRSARKSRERAAKAKKR